MDGLHGLEAWVRLLSLRIFLPGGTLLTSPSHPPAFLQRWLFIVEGVITCGAACISIFLLPDYPGTTKRLSLREKALAVYRLERDTGIKDDDTLTLFQSFKLAALDPKLYLLALIIITKTTAGAVTQFFPSASPFPPARCCPLPFRRSADEATALCSAEGVVQTMGFSKVITLLLTAPRTSAARASSSAPG